MLKDDGLHGLIERYARRNAFNSFETVMIMRFIFLPYDAVSYLAGFLRIEFWPFILLGYRAWLDTGHDRIHRFWRFDPEALTARYPSLIR